MQVKKGQKPSETMLYLRIDPAHDQGAFRRGRRATFAREFFGQWLRYYGGSIKAQFRQRRGPSRTPRSVRARRPERRLVSRPGRTCSADWRPPAKATARCSTTRASCWPTSSGPRTPPRGFRCSWRADLAAPSGPFRTGRSVDFELKTILTWLKVRKDGAPDRRGVGFYFRNVTEAILFGVKGSLRTLGPARRQPNLIAACKREHSRKPGEIYDIIEACSRGPYLELFARVPRHGWSQWGDQLATFLAPPGTRGTCTTRRPD